MADGLPHATSGCRRRQLGCCDAAFLAFLLLGTATLFPWNALITAADYWEAIFPASPAVYYAELPSTGARPSVCCWLLSMHTVLLFLYLQGKHIDRLFTITYLPINLVMLAAMIRWHAAVRPRLRIVGGLSGFTLASKCCPQGCHSNCNALASAVDIAAAAALMTVGSM